MRLLPPADWWFVPPPGRGWWRAHAPAHFGHGALFTLAWALIGVGSPFIAGVFFVVLWEAFQREYWTTPTGESSMPLWSNVWDAILGTAGAGLAALTMPF